MSLKILDTSAWQASKVDYAAAKIAGYSGVILRVGCGNSKDKCFEADYKKAINAGLLIGVYYYTYSQTAAQAVNDATKVLGWLNGRHIDLPVAYDVEDSKQKGTLRKATNSAMYNAFASKIKEKSYDCMLYTGEYFFNNYFDKSAVNDKLWIAKYSSKSPAVGKNIYMWQYTSNAISTDFYKKPLDRSYLYENVVKEPTSQSIVDKDITIYNNPFTKPSTNIKKGDKGEGVKWVQWYLWRFGLINKSDIDGIFGPQTDAAVKEAQKRLGLVIDGIVGKNTKTVFESLI